MRILKALLFAGAAAAVGYVVVRWFQRREVCSPLLNPTCELRDATGKRPGHLAALDQLEKAHRLAGLPPLDDLAAHRLAFWDQFLDRLTLGPDRAKILADALDPQSPRYLLRWPALPMSYDMWNDDTWPGIPTAEEWIFLLVHAAGEAKQTTVFGLQPIDALGYPGVVFY